MAKTFTSWVSDVPDVGIFKHQVLERPDGKHINGASGPHEACTHGIQHPGTAMQHDVGQLPLLKALAHDDVLQLPMSKPSYPVKRRREEKQLPCGCGLGFNDLHWTLKSIDNMTDIGLCGFLG